MPVYDPKTAVGEILTTKLASITKAPLPPGAPSWKDLRRLTWKEIEDGARANRPGFRAIRKLLTNLRFEK